MHEELLLVVWIILVVSVINFWSIQLAFKDVVQVIYGFIGIIRILVLRIRRPIRSKIVHFIDLELFVSDNFLSPPPLLLFLVFGWFLTILIFKRIIGLNLRIISCDTNLRSNVIIICFS